MAYLKSPCHPGVDTCDFLFTCYAMKTQAVEDVINALARCEDPNDADTQRRIFATHDLCLDVLTPAEIDYIEREVAKRR